MHETYLSLDFNTFALIITIHFKMSKKKIAFIHNPISGKGKQKNIPQLIGRHLDLMKFDFQIFNSEYAGHMSTLTIEALFEGFEIIIVVGGDGSVNEVFPNLIDSNIVFGIIPCGSGNGLARFLNIPMNPKKAIRLINKLPIQKIDTAEINGHPFISIAGVGFDSHVADLFSKSTKRGFWSYFKISLKAYSSYDENEYQIILNNGQTEKIKAWMICFANSNQFGNNVIISPKAKINDGLIDICIVEKFPFWAIPFSMILVFTGLVDKSRYYKRVAAQKVSIKSQQKQMVNIDGEAIPMDSEIELNVVPSSINIICPKP